MKKIVILFIILLTGFSSHEQEASYYRIDTIPVYNYGRKLAFPWVGGINSPQFSPVTLEKLGISLLVLFDRCGNHFYTFLNEEIPDSPSYVYAPQYEKNFPACQGFALLRDYNCDGIPDIFSSTYIGIDVYRGFYNENNELDFKLASPELTFPYKSTNGIVASNIEISGNDLPAIDDIEGNGTMGILLFGLNGGFINYYRNTSIDSGWGCDSLRYVWQSGCWGKVFDNYYLTMLLNVCQGFGLTPPPHSGSKGDPDQVEHHLGNTLCTFDEDSSGHKSALWGGLTFPNTVFIHNAGFPDTFYVDWQDTTFPSYNVPDSIRSWPAAFSFDVDNDGYKDLLFAPNYPVGAQDFNNVRYYKQMPGLYNNTGTKYQQYYQYQNDSLFSKDMIDVGSGSAPTFFHYFNGDDTISDLIIGSIGSYNINSSIQNGRLMLYRNTGTHNHPVFQLVSKDFDSISNYSLSAVVPTFGDLRGNGTEDMILGNSYGTLYYFKNVVAIGHPAQYILPNADSAGQNYDGITVDGGYSAPQLVDVDGDGLLDLIIGCQSGTLSYYHNDGTANTPKFDLVSSNWGVVNVAHYDTSYNTTYDTINGTPYSYIDTIISTFAGYSHPFLYRDSTGKSVLLVGSSYAGTIFRYDNIDNNLNGNFTLTTDTFANIATGYETQCAVSGASIFGHANPEIAVGNYRGGVTIYTTSGKPTGIEQVQKLWMNCVLYPNPSNNIITINLPGVTNTSIVNVDVENELGQKVISHSYENQQTKITMQVSQLPEGLYFCRITIGNDFVVRKFVVTHRE